MNNKLYVGNISFNTSDRDLQDAFDEFGTALEVHLVTDRATGRPRGFGFVTMSTEEEAQAAIEGLNGKTIDGRALTVNIARPREDRPPGGGGGGGGGRRY
ncbi:MAG: RNA recognition motif-containing protein [Candidatus Binatia bacterium]|jgi:RNA recognition motif-containing protein